jgi:hypothetical protein
MKDTFYSALFKVWAQIHCHDPINAEEVCRQPLWDNTFIRIENNTLKKEKYPQIGVHFVQDLIGTDGRMASKGYLDQKFKVIIPIMTYNSIMAAIPTKWKKYLYQDNNCLNYYVFTEHRIRTGNSNKKIEEVVTKDLYWDLVTEIAERPTSETTWEKEVGICFSNDEWAMIYNLPYSLTRDTRITMLQYKISHRIVACKKKLHTWKVEKDSTCDFCKEEEDCIEHHLVACPKTLQFWTCCFNWFKATTQVSFPINTYDIVYNIPTSL